MENSESTIYKICTQAEWQTALALESYRGSADDVRDGFIHFSFAHQVAATADKYFRGRTDLVLVAVNAQALGSALRHEASRGGALFPHLYAELPTQAALWVAPLVWQGDTFRLPERLT
jgi:uncharacterized protein (DUF952 family)